MIRPHRTIGDRYLERWHLIPRNRWFNIYLHRFSGSDDGRYMHDHPWWSVSILLRGRIEEHTPYGIPYSPENGGRLSGLPHYRFFMPRLWPVFRPADHIHRILLVGRRPAWTLFITGPKVREWGYYTPDGWVNHAQMDGMKTA